MLSLRSINTEQQKGGYWQINGADADSDEADPT